MTPVPARTASAAAQVIVMTTREVPAAYSIGSAEREHEGGDDEEAAADAEEPGEQADRRSR